MTVMTDRERDDDKAAEEPDVAESAEEPDVAESATGSDVAESATGSDVAESATGSDKATDAGRPPWRRRAAIGAVALLIFAGFATSGVLGWQLWQQRQVADAAAAARNAAVDYAQVLTSIDSANVDENFNQVLAGATGEFKDMYSQSSAELRQLLIDNKATAHGIVTESAVESAAKNEVVVLLFVDQSVSNTAVPDPRIDRSRIKMTMQDVDGRWLASKVELR